MVRFGRADGRFVLLCLGVIAVFGALGAAGFSRAFPEASIDFRVTRGGARDVARKALEARGFDLTGTRVSVVFDHDDEAKVFLERTLGLKRANPLFETTVPVWRWAVRFVRPLEKLEYRAAVSPRGDLLAFRRLLPEGAPAPDPGDDAARRLAEAELDARALDPAEAASLRLVEATTERRPARVDRAFVWESSRIRFGDAALRYRVETQGDRVSRSTVALEVPEAWKNDYRTLRSKNEAANGVATFGFLLTAVALLATFLQRVRRRDVKWRLALAFGTAAAVLQLASALNELPLRLADYDTADSYRWFVVRGVLSDFGGALLLGAFVAFLVAAGEPLYREAYPSLPALGPILSRRGLESKRFFKGVLLGYALTAFFFAYQVVFYIGAERLGAWAPADVPYSELLGTSFPWLSVLLAGFVPATTEEFSSRMFSIPFCERFLPRWGAVLLPALVWGFGHSAYPNQPFYIRGVEVGLAGVIVGFVMLRAGLLPLLVWHFTIDALYTALLLIRSSNTYMVLSGAAAAGALLVPLLLSLVLYAKNGGFADDASLSNAAAGSAPPLPPADGPEPIVFAPPRPLDPSRALSFLVLAFGVAVVSRLVLPRAGLEGDGDLFRISRGDARLAADAFVRKMGDDPSAYLAVPTVGSALPALEEESDAGALVPYDWSADAERWLREAGGVALLRRWATEVLPGPVWQVRYLRPLDRHGWWVVVDARTARVVGFNRSLPREEPGGSPDDAASREKAEGLLASFGLTPSSFTLVSSTAEKQKARLDHRLVFESRTDRVRGAPLRLVAVLAGDRPARLATALKLPEAWLRARELTTPAAYAAIAWKVFGLGAVVGLLLVQVVRCARRGAIPWRRAARWGSLLTLPTLLRQLAALPLLLRSAPADATAGTIVVNDVIRLSIELVLVFGLSLAASAAVLAARPDAFAAFRRGGSPGGRALAAAGLTVLSVLAVRSFGGNLASAFPREIELGRLPVPPGIDTLFPAAVVLEAGIRLAVLLGGLGAVLALLLGDLLEPLRMRVVSALLLTGAFVKLDVRTASELLVPLLGSLLVPAAFLAAMVWLLRDDPRAYLFTGLGLELARGALPLLSSPVLWWQVNGGMLIALAGGLVVWRGLDRRE